MHRLRDCSRGVHRHTPDSGTAVLRDTVSRHDRARGQRAGHPYSLGDFALQSAGPPQSAASAWSAELAALRAQVAALEKANRANTGSASTASTRTTTATIVPDNLYCYTHGQGSHTGADCRSPGPNHRPEATWTNQMGGESRTSKQRRKELFRK